MKILKIITLTILVAVASQVKAADNTGITDVIKAYMGLKNALAADNGNTANTEAKRLGEALMSVKVEAMDPIQKFAWKTHADKLMANARLIGQSADLKRQRTYFQPLSDDMFHLIKKTMANDVVLYRQYCPMKKAYWLSQSTIISNPYYGKEMAECGEVKETLKAH